MCVLFVLCSVFSTVNNHERVDPTVPSSRSPSNPGGARAGLALIVLGVLSVHVEVPQRVPDVAAAAHVRRSVAVSAAGPGAGKRTGDDGGSCEMRLWAHDGGGGERTRGEERRTHLRLPAETPTTPLMLAGNSMVMLEHTILGLHPLVRIACPAMWEASVKPLSRPRRNDVPPRNWPYELGSQIPLPVGPGISRPSGEKSVKLHMYLLST